MLVMVPVPDACVGTDASARVQCQTLVKVPVCT